MLSKFFTSLSSICIKQNTFKRQCSILMIHRHKQKSLLTSLFFSSYGWFLVDLKRTSNCFFFLNWEYRSYATNYYEVTVPKTFLTYLDFLLEAVKRELFAVETVAYLVLLNPLVGLVSTLCCHSHDLWHFTKVNFDVLKHIAVSRNPSPRAPAIEEIQTSPPRSVSRIPHRWRLEGIFGDSSVLETQWRTTCSWKSRIKGEKRGSIK